MFLGDGTLPTLAQSYYTKKILVGGFCSQMLPRHLTEEFGQ